MNQTDPTTASVREQLLDALDFSYCQGLGYAEPAELLAAYDRERVAVVSPPPSRAAALSDAERTMLTYALDQAQEHIWSRDGFTDEDQVAVDSLRRLAVEAHDTGTQRCVCGEPEAPGTVHRADGPCYVAKDAPAPVPQQPRAVPPGCWYDAAAAEEAMRDEPLDEPGPAAQQPAAFEVDQDSQTGPKADSKPVTADGEETPVIPCGLAILKRLHGTHRWEPQPGMNGVRCPGYTA